MVKLTENEMREAEIPKRFLSLPVETYDGCPDALDMTKKYVKRFKKASKDGVGLLYVGETNTMKTFLATLLVKSLLYRHFTARYLTIDSLQQKMHSNPISSVASENDNLIVLDDVNRPSSSNIGAGWQVNLVKKFIRYRTDNLLPFVLCTQLRREEFESAYGDEVARRISANLIAVDCTTQLDPTKTHEKLKRKAQALLED